MSLTRRAFSFVLAVSGGLLVAVPAHAQYPSSTDATSFVASTASIGLTEARQNMKNGAPQTSNVATYAPSSTFVTSTASLLPGAYGTAYSSVAAGQMKVYAQSAYPYNGFNQNVQARSVVNFFDSGLVKGNNIGDPAQYMVTLHVVGVTTPTPQQIFDAGNANFAYILSTLDVSDSSGAILPQLRYAYGTGGKDALTQPFATIQVFFNTAVGRTVYIHGYMDAATYVSGLNAGVSSAEVAYQNSANVYMDSNTPGVSITFASGHNFATPIIVPEAGTALLALCAVVGWGGNRVIRRRGK